MSASIALHIETQNQLLVPIAAIKQEKGNRIVNILAEDGSLIARPISTGTALADKVIIASGLKPGEIVAYE